MSRGPGRVQNAVLAVLAAQPAGWASGWLSLAEIVEQVFEVPASRAQTESVRRALKSLAGQGVVELDLMLQFVPVSGVRVSWREGQYHRRKHDRYRPILFAHCTLSVEQREAREQFYAESLDRLVEIDRTGGADR